MAITYDHIKGRTADADSQENYTLITFKKDKTPEIGYSNNNSGINGGNLLVSDNDNQTIANTKNIDFLFNNNIFFKSISGRFQNIAIESDHYGQLKILNPTVGSPAAIDYGSLYSIVPDGSAGGITMSNGGLVGVGCDNGCTHLTDFVGYDYTNNRKEMGLTTDGKLETCGSITAGTSIKAAISITAPYFNATSDFRAKQDIVSLPSALNFVLDTDIYTFTFKEDPQKKRTVGVIAQNLQDKTLYGVNFVNKPENPNDMLSVNESKFVYVLWKAIQEQQEEIAELRSQIAELKKE